MVLLEIKETIFKYGINYNEDSKTTKKKDEMSYFWDEMGWVRDIVTS